MRRSFSSSQQSSLSSFSSFADDTSSHTGNGSSGNLAAFAAVDAIAKSNGYHEGDTAGPLRERVRRRRLKTTRRSPMRSRSKSRSGRGLRRMGSGSFHKSLFRRELEETDHGSDEEEPTPPPKQLEVLTHREKRHGEYLQLCFESTGSNRSCHCESHPLSSKVSRHRRRVHSRYAQLAV